MKTAMQEFIYDELRGEAKVMAYYLKKEEEQTKEAFTSAEYLCFLKDRLDYGEEDIKFHNSDEYYNVTFGNDS